MSDTCPYCRGTGKIDATMATRLTALRQIKGVKQEDVAEAANVSRTQIANLERGRGDPSIPVLLRLAQYFNVTTDYLLGVGAASEGSTDGN